jgi:hypothetical protein
LTKKQHQDLKDKDVIVIDSSDDEQDYDDHQQGEIEESRNKATKFLKTIHMPIMWIQTTAFFLIRKTLVHID